MFTVVKTRVSDGAIAKSRDFKFSDHESAQQQADLLNDNFRRAGFDWVVIDATGVRFT